MSPWNFLKSLFITAIVDLELFVALKAILLHRHSIFTQVLLTKTAHILEVSPNSKASGVTHSQVTIVLVESQSGAIFHEKKTLFQKIKRLRVMRRYLFQAIDKYFI